MFHVLDEIRTFFLLHYTFTLAGCDTVLRNILRTAKTPNENLPKFDVFSKLNKMQFYFSKKIENLLSSHSKLCSSKCYRLAKKSSSSLI